MKRFLSYFLTVVLMLFLKENGNAQLCTGSLGDPVVNITFGSGSNPGPALGSITTYSFFSASCPQDGSYTIANDNVGCFGNTWHSIFEDHTPGDVNGYMMIVNASFNPGVFYLDTVKNLCGGTTYEFSAWLMNVLKSSACNGIGINPNITFSIETTDGTVLQSYLTGNIPNLPSPQWNHYGFYFTLPTNYSSLVLRMVNNAPGGCGNDIALDDITFRPCGPKVDAAFINVNGNGDTANYCISDNKVISISGSVQTGYNDPRFQWQQSNDSGKTWLDIPGETNSTYTRTYSVAGRFQYRMSAAEAGNIGIARCRVASNVLFINIDAIPIPMAANSSPVCVNAPITFSAKNGNSYQWTGPNGFSASIASPVIASAIPANAGKYYVLVTTKGGCSKLDSTTILQVHPLPLADAGNDVTICEGTSTTLTASGGVLYRWDADATLSDTTIANPVANPLVTTTYSVGIGSQFFCWARDTVKVTVVKKPTADAGPDKRITEGESVTLTGVAGGSYSSYFWTPAQYINDVNALTPVVNPLFDFIYTLHVLSTNICEPATDNVFVRVFQKVIIPNAFSPNGDGINDVWKIEKLETYPESVTSVFNRYGQLVFRSQGYPKPWDGRYNSNPLPVGTYYYTIDRKNNFPVLSGWVMILR